MQVLAYCPFLHCLAVCPPTCCAGKSVWAAIWQMIPGWCGRVKLFQGRKVGFLSDPFPFTPFSSNMDLMSSQTDGVARAFADLHRSLNHPLDPQEMCAMPCQTQLRAPHCTAASPSRANAGHLPRMFPGLGLRKNKAFALFTPTETSEESPAFVNWVRHLGNNKNIHKQLKTFSQLLLITFTEEGLIQWS